MQDRQFNLLIINPDKGNFFPHCYRLDQYPRSGRGYLLKRLLSYHPLFSVNHYNHAINKSFCLTMEQHVERGGFMPFKMH